MIFESTHIPDVVLITPERIHDERGYFTRTWGQDDFEARGLNSRVVARNVSYNGSARTLRGMHYQRAPHQEVKVVLCTQGVIFDVAVDLRPESPTFRRWVGTELTPETGAMLYIPEGFAHGFQTLTDDCELLYLHTAAYRAGSESAVNALDPRLKIRWPLAVEERSARDEAHAPIAADFLGVS